VRADIDVGDDDVGGWLGCSLSFAAGGQVRGSDLNYFIIPKFMTGHHLLR
jgi:hypothetical protein